MGGERSCRGGARMRHARVKKLNTRMKTLRTLRSAVGDSAGRMIQVAKAGPRPLGTYGDKAMGFSDHELAQVRRALCKAMVPVARGSMTGKICVAWGGPCSH